ncbi:unnamed protein product [Cuscuta epithymum]|uniref:YTH domain-containing family protein n=1 Tax=Cuscuta epithymum TaxID=186058 RepID=A0AAV0E1E0_9ASTE|nr:unnamed protein product [Cuscuta epithymum]
MDAVGPPPDRTTEELLQILTLDVDREKAHRVQECTKKNKLLEISALPFYQDSTGPSMFCNSNRYPSPTYYYGGYDGSTASDWDRYVMPGGAEVPPNMYDNYQTGYSYAPYETYSPSCSNVGHDNKPQQYPYPTRHVQPSSTNNGTYSWNQPTDVHSKVISSIVSSQLLFPGETKGNKYYNSTGLVNRTNIMKPVRHSYQHSLLKSPDAYGWGNKSAAPHWSSSPAAQISNFHSRESQNLQHPRHVMVNASGQFVGLAEMVGPVDYDKTVEYWQQDKWNGCFHVKWHIVKDVPNSMLRHIRLENNENKPVTNSRDTQEVGLEQGNQILKIFKEHFSKTCILDDIDFYEGRQKMMHEKKAKQLLSSNKQDGNVKPAVVVSAQKVVGEIDTEGFTSLNGGVKRREQQRSFAAVLISHDNKSHKTA